MKALIRGRVFGGYISNKLCKYVSSYISSITTRHTGARAKHNLGGECRGYEFFEVGFHGDRYLLDVVQSIAPVCRYFIETGSNVGSTLSYVARIYPHLECLSCEPDTGAFRHALENVKSLSNVRVFNEISQDFLRRIEKEYKGVLTEKVMIWLDAHGYGFQWPLREEVSFITHKFKTAYILIDDCRVPGLDCFGYDAYGEQECSFEYIKDALNPQLDYTVYYPSYTTRTSEHHPLRGWMLIAFGHQDEFTVADSLIGRIHRSQI